LCITINRKAQPAAGPLPRLTRQDISALAEHSEQADRNGKLATTLVFIEVFDVNKILEAICCFCKNK
jgi:hypothetical protein